MKSFTRRQLRSIHKSQRAKEERRAAQLLKNHTEGPTARPSVIAQLCGNLDRLVIVASLRFPDFKPGLVDRLLALAEIERLPALIVLTKADLCLPEEAETWRNLYRQLGYRTIVTSITAPSLDVLQEQLQNGRSAFCGHSGVGKSTLLSLLAPDLLPETGSVSDATRKGKHTTTRVQLYRLPQGGELFDLPGLKLAPLHCTALQLARAFPEFNACRCRFRDCLHRTETGCGVKEAVKLGVVHPQRYESYLRILDSLE